MALYKEPLYLTKATDAAFDVEHAPGETTPHSGIYRCMGCGWEVVSEAGRSFRPKITILIPLLKGVSAGNL